MSDFVRWMKRLPQRIGLIVFACGIGAALGCGCSSGSNVPPAPPVDTGLTLMRCGVQEVAGEMHVQWVADRVTSGEIRYGESSYTQLIRVSALADSHDIVISGLSFSMNYVYQIRIFDHELNSAECEGQFRTPHKARPEPVISGFEITEITETSARLSWRTDEPATTILKYGVAAPQDSIIDPAFTFIHDVRVASLTPSTIYDVRPEAVDSTNLRGVGRDSSFATVARLTLWFEGATIALGDTEDVRVHIENATDLAALQYTIEFATGRLEIVDLVEGGFYTENQGFAFFRGIRNSRGEVANHLTWAIEYNGSTRVGTDADGAGIVATLRMRGVTPGAANATFAADSSFGLDMFAQMRVCSLRTGTIVVTEGE